MNDMSSPAQGVGCNKCDALVGQTTGDLLCLLLAVFTACCMFCLSGTTACKVNGMVSVDAH